MSIGVVCNIYQEENAIAGFMESAAGFFDDIVFLHAGPGGARSTDGTIETIEKWGARIVYGSIDDGFGTVRTQAVRLSDCEWAMILDADERFHANAPMLECDDALNVRQAGEPYNQGAWLRSIVSSPESADIDAVCTMRRHWFDFSWKRPTQNFTAIPDLQLRIVRNIPSIIYRAYPRMHEQIIDTRTDSEPRHFRPHPAHGPFHDHYHCWFKAMEVEQRKHDIAIYNALHEEKPVPSWTEFEAIQRTKMEV